MKTKPITQFISFDTRLDQEAFDQVWAQLEPAHGDVVVQQQKAKNNKFRYWAQYNVNPNELDFLFDSPRKGVNAPMGDVRRKNAGGYSFLQRERQEEAGEDESKVLIFLTDPAPNLDSFREFRVHGKLNIYEAYFESCTYSYILELYVKDHYVQDVLNQLKIFTAFAEAGIYKECPHRANC